MSTATSRCQCVSVYVQPRSEIIKPYSLLLRPLVELLQDPYASKGFQKVRMRVSLLLWRVRASWMP